ncbi:T6SS phospholipase effector Tle1-like catalytic domain-containing protein [Pseudomonas huanghezhanensis]|uniref:T6SS phospholipase effector Tle1-like catalytic domain-containing protein n=1 Tax=Pseudomonas huanghezhanensis TaxID=3002903 RepID=UPI002285EFF8|nr:DUF2235 domain-containing protein [Pseudomonas sp. BSw22131]
MTNEKNNTLKPDISLNASLAVTLRLGIFFDGTGNNRINSQIGADCRAMAEIYHHKHIKECGGRHSDPNSSYANELTNIALLADLYKKQPVARNNGDGLRAYHSIYVSGIGTTSGGRDFISGLSFGRGHTGVVAKVVISVKKILKVLGEFSAHNPGCVIAALELDLFGFSRGAAAARHLANEVLKQHNGLFEKIMARRGLPLSEAFTWANACIRLKVIGLFDTVAAIGSICDLGSVSDSVNKRVNLFLPPGCAQEVIHLVAGDEQRRNFSLNSIAPGWEREITVPGAHSDVGGGYPAQLQETLLLTRPRRSQVSLQTLSEDTHAFRETQAELQAMDRLRWLDPRDAEAHLQVKCWERHSHSTRGMKEVWAAVSLERTVFGHLSRVYLRLMHALALEQGVPLVAVPATDVLSIPPELREISLRLIEQGQKGRIVLSEYDARVLSRRYIHRSAHWNTFVGKSTLWSDSFFIHAPGSEGRTRFPNDQQPGYPQ